MEKLMTLSKEMKDRILEFLYLNEVLNVFLIHYIENQVDALGEIYVGFKDNEINSLVHIKNDGHSNFTSFFVKSDKYLKEVANCIQSIKRPNILLAGRESDVRIIQDYNSRSLDMNIYNYYILSVDQFPIEKTIETYGFRKVKESSEDIEKVKQYLIEFFWAQTEVEKNKITCEKEVQAKLETGIYLLEVNRSTVGMARFFGSSENYIDINTLYIDEKYRGKGYGKLLIQTMVEEALKKEKITVLQASKTNIAARKIYEALGFYSAYDYAFQLISNKY